jgi:hypothetical protein
MEVITDRSIWNGQVCQVLKKEIKGTSDIQ